ncbi:MAG: 1-acyl-sn-glycerol-3-phosphate acyltransferase, partial [Myxococcales bacterium]|nr:1-acyl-sn-glycerol-3-phosphate acyltransferase [Myxococcales bacterium]
MEGFNIEFFLEGGRSRTGKLLAPKYGLLSMMVDACIQTPSRKVHFVPISIGYERIIEAGSYVDELTGGEKQKENLSGLLRTPRVLRRKYGRLYVQIGRIIPFEAPPTTADSRAPSPAARRRVVQHIAHQVTHEINRVTVVTPASLVATALLLNRGSSLSQSGLVELSRVLARTLEDLGARFARTLQGPSSSIRLDTVEEATRLFLDGKLIARHERSGEVRFTVPDERRIALEYYKNNLLHFFVPAALISAALLKPGTGRTVAMVRAQVDELSRLFKYEFLFH